MPVYTAPAAHNSVIKQLTDKSHLHLLMGLPATTTLMYGRSVESTVGAEPAGKTPPYPIGWIAPKEMEYAKALYTSSNISTSYI